MVLEPAAQYRASRTPDQTLNLHSWTAGGARCAPRGGGSMVEQRLWAGCERERRDRGAAYRRVWWSGYFPVAAVHQGATRVTHGGGGPYRLVNHLDPRHRLRVGSIQGQVITVGPEGRGVLPSRKAPGQPVIKDESAWLSVQVRQRRPGHGRTEVVGPVNVTPGRGRSTCTAIPRLPTTPSGRVIGRSGLVGEL